MPSADSILIMKFTLLVRSSLIAELLPIELTLIAECMLSAELMSICACMPNLECILTIKDSLH